METKTEDIDIKKIIDKKLNERTPQEKEVIRGIYIAVASEIIRLNKEKQIYLNSQEVKTLDRFINKKNEDIGQLIKILDKLDKNNDLQAIKPKPVKSLTSSITTLDKKLFNNELIEINKEQDVQVLKDLYIKTTISNEQQLDIKLSKYDKLVCDTIGTFLDKGHDIFTTKQLVNFMNNGVITNEKVSEQQEQEAYNTIRKLSSQYQVINMQDIMKSKSNFKKRVEEYNKEHGKENTTMLEGTLLKVDILKNIPLLDSNNKTYITNVIKVYAPPITFVYGSKLKQIATYPANLLNIKDTKSPKDRVNITKDAIQIRTALIERILQIKSQYDNKNSKYHNNEVLLDKLFLNSGISEETLKNRTQTKRLKDKTFKMLNGFKEKGFIKDYTKIENSKKSIYKIAIIIK